jgi:hypothetical protein
MHTFGLNRIKIGLYLSILVVVFTMGIVSKCIGKHPERSVIEKSTTNSHVRR